MAAPSGAAVGGRWKAFVGSNQTVQTVLLALKKEDPTMQDEHVPYVGLSKTLKLALGVCLIIRTLLETRKR